MDIKHFQPIIRRRIRILAGMLVSVVIAACASPPGSDPHRALADPAAQGAVAVLVWVPEDFHGPLWLQFEPRNAAGRPAGQSVSVHLAEKAVWSAQLPTRAGWRSRLALFPLEPGAYLLSRWAGELPGDNTPSTSTFIGWPFEVGAGDMLALGRLTLMLGKQDRRQVAYTLTAAGMDAGDLQPLYENVPAGRAFHAIKDSPVAGRSIDGAALRGGSIGSSGGNPQSITVYIP